MATTEERRSVGEVMGSPRESFCYLNGSFVPVSKAQVSVYDIGILRGFGVYEALVTYNRKPFMLEDHLIRLRNSAKRMELQVPASDEAVRAALEELLARNIPEDREGLIRVILTGGTAIDGIDYNPETPTFLLLMEEFKPLEEHYFTEGAAVATTEHLRQFPEFKSTNYIQAVLLQRRKREEGVLEFIYTYGGRMLECTGSNIFIVKNGTIITPERDVLPGITRKVTIAIAKKEFPLEERDITADEFFGADEAFLTSSFKEIVPIVRADGKAIGGGNPGPVTRRLMELFKEFTRAY